MIFQKHVKFAMIFIKFFADLRTYLKFIAIS